jgi:hypothetical protein
VGRKLNVLKTVLYEISRALGLGHNSLLRRINIIRYRKIELVITIFAKTTKDITAVKF